MKQKHQIGRLKSAVRELEQQREVLQVEAKRLVELTARLTQENKKLRGVVE